MVYNTKESTGDKDRKRQCMHNSLVETKKDKGTCLIVVLANYDLSVCDTFVITFRCYCN